MQAAYPISMEIERPIRTTRRLRLIALLSEFGGPKNLSQRAAQGLTDTHLIACSKGRRNIGDELAASLEIAGGKPFGWMDQPVDLVAEATKWPFEAVEQDQFDRLTEREKGEAEAALRKAIEEIESRRKANRLPGSQAA